MGLFKRIVNRENFYRRQWMLHGIGQEGVDRMRSCRVLVVGAGGLGSPLLLYLANSAVEQLGVVDDDEVDESNLARQILYNYGDIGRNKAQVAKEKLLLQNPFVSIEIYNERFSVETAFVVVDRYDVVIDCTDNFSTKFLLHDVCYRLKKTLIMGAIYQWSGWIKTFDFQDETRPCLRCLWKDVIADSLVKNCSEVGILPSSCMAVASYMVNETIKILLERRTLRDGEDFLIDLLGPKTEIIRWSKDGNCSLCSKGRESFSLGDYTPLAPFEVRRSTLSGDVQWILLDVRDIKDISPHDLKSDPILAMMKKLDTQSVENVVNGLSKKDNILVLCYTGKRSYSKMLELRQRGFENVYSLKGGIRDYLAY